MWPNAYFGRRYFCARFWVKVGATPVFQAAWIAEDQIVSRVKREPIN